MEVGTAISSTVADSRRSQDWIWKQFAIRRLRSHSIAVPTYVTNNSYTSCTITVGITRRFSVFLLTCMEERHDHCHDSRRILFPGSRDGSTSIWQDLWCPLQRSLFSTEEVFSPPKCRKRQAKDQRHFTRLSPPPSGSQRGKIVTRDYYH